MVWQSISSYLDYSFADMGFGVDGLQSYDDVSCLDGFVEQLVETTIDNKDGILRDGGLHWFARSWSDWDDFRVKQVECSDCGYDHETLEYLMAARPHLLIIKWQRALLRLTAACVQIERCSAREEEENASLPKFPHQKWWAQGPRP